MNVDETDIVIAIRRGKPPAPATGLTGIKHTHAKFRLYPAQFFFDLCSNARINRVLDLIHARFSFPAMGGMQRT
ncbi:MAG: hypothetical protein ACD_10C00865G0002 [uncultured bacterium]|nr:MAG: hypothetical protein ACD_10C00865G0002 [uncultured bacterium]